MLFSVALAVVLAFVVEGRAFIVTSRAFVVEGCAFVVEGCAFVVEGCAFVVEGCAFVVEGCAFVVEGCAFVVEGCALPSAVDDCFAVDALFILTALTAEVTTVACSFVVCEVNTAEEV